MIALDCYAVMGNEQDVWAYALPIHLCIYASMHLCIRPGTRYKVQETVHSTGITYYIRENSTYDSTQYIGETTDERRQTTVHKYKRQYRRYRRQNERQYIGYSTYGT
jgi:hypothetical protein